MLYTYIYVYSICICMYACLYLKYFLVFWFSDFLLLYRHEANCVPIVVLMHTCMFVFVCTSMCLYLLATCEHLLVGYYCCSHTYNIYSFFAVSAFLLLLLASLLTLCYSFTFFWFLFSLFFVFVLTFCDYNFFSLRLMPLFSLLLHS